MKKLSCKDIGGEGCNFVATGETNKEVIDKMFAHAARAHKDILVKMSESEKRAMMTKMNELLSKQ